MLLLLGNQKSNSVTANNRFIWENQGDQYTIDPNKKYLIYYQGMFAPPTRGHYSIVERFASYPNVKILIQQIGSANRHGVPYWLNREIWQIYIDLLISRSQQSTAEIHLIDAMEFNKFDYMSDVDTVLVVRGYEADISHDEQRYLDSYEDWMIDYDVDMEFLFVERIDNGRVSASKFIDALLNPKTSKEELVYFLPTGLSSDMIDHIINSLNRFPLFKPLGT